MNTKIINKTFARLCKLLLFWACLTGIDVTAQQASLLTVEDKLLKDDCGETIILKGFNHGNIYDVSDFGTGEMAQIALTGANAVRLVVATQYCTFPPPNYNCVNVPTGAPQLQTMLQSSLQNDLIPVVELHDFTGSANPAADLVTAANWWSQPAILEVLLAHQNYLIVNIANEPSSSNYPPSASEQLVYFNANVSAVSILRNAGLTCPIMIDGMHWGKDHTFFVNYGSQLMLADPLQKLIYSVHAYWPATGNAIQVTDAQITNYMNALATVDAPIVLGELAHDEVQNNGTFPINYPLLLDLAAQHDFGYLIWWWGRIESGSSSPLYVTSNGLLSGLTPQGQVLVNTHANAVEPTSVRPYKLVNGVCNDLDVGTITPLNSMYAFPNPFDHTLQLQGETAISKMELYSVSGRKVAETTTKSLSTSDIATGIYLLKVFTNGQVLTYKVMKQ